MRDRDVESATAAVAILTRLVGEGRTHARCLLARALALRARIAFARSAGAIGEGTAADVRACRAVLREVSRSAVDAQRRVGDAERERVERLLRPLRRETNRTKGEPTRRS